jgi:hypothetical protein
MDFAALRVYSITPGPSHQEPWFITVYAAFLRCAAAIGMSIAPRYVSSRRFRHFAGYQQRRERMLWTILVILLVLWLVGFLGHIGGGLIHLLLVIALIVFIINLVSGRRAV